MKNEKYYSYVYRITHLPSGFHYYGSRFCIMKNRYSHEALEDLKKYQSSSKNENWKQRIKEYPEEFKFKIIKKFYENRKIGEMKALNYEAKLHNKFDVVNNPKFINRHNEPEFNLEKYTNRIFELIDFEGKEVKFKWDDIPNILDRYNIVGYKSTLLSVLNTSIKIAKNQAYHVQNKLFTVDYYNTYISYMKPKFEDNVYTVYNNSGRKLVGTYYELIKKLDRKDAFKIIHHLLTYNSPYVKGYYVNLEAYIDHNKTICKLINTETNQIFKLYKNNRRDFMKLSGIGNPNIHSLINYDIHSDTLVTYNNWMRIEQFNKLTLQTYKITNGRIIKNINKITQYKFRQEHNYSINCYRLFGGDLKVYDVWYLVDYWKLQAKTISVIVDIKTGNKYKLSHINKVSIVQKLNELIQNEQKCDYDIGRYLMNLVNNQKNILKDRFVTLEKYNFLLNKYIIVECTDNTIRHINKIDTLLNNTLRLVFNKLSRSKIGSTSLGYKLIEKHI